MHVEVYIHGGTVELEKNAGAIFILRLFFNPYFKGL